jgi:hypothetical protein
MADNEFKLLQRSIHNQRYQMELTLESAPREVYSNQLMEAMRREEMAMRDGVKITPEMSKSIDDALRSETRVFFHKIASDNIRRWANLQVKIDNEYARFYQGSRARKRDSEMPNDGSRTGKDIAIAAVTTASTISEPNSTETGLNTDSVNQIKKDLSEADLNAEILRLEEDYNRQWLTYEQGNLRTAFASQMERVETEWTSHEQNLTDDFNKKKISEKIGHNRQKEGSKSLSQKQFTQNLEHLQAQKAASHRWMIRQEIRLTAQAVELGVERSKIADLISGEIGRVKERPK